MTSNSRYSEIKRLFDAALSLDVEARSAFLEQESRDDRELLREVRSLLDAHQRGDAIPERAPSWLLTEEPAGPRVPPSHIGDFRIVRTLGEGGMGTVYVAEQQSPRREVALKVMRRSVMSDEGHRRFEVEGRALAQLAHDSIARVFLTGEADTPDGKQPFIAMELIDGMSLSEYVARTPLDVPRRLKLLAQVAKGVHCAHSRSIVHRDLKPANILVNAEGSPKIVDFGIARFLDSDIALTTRDESVGRIMGTLQYMSPEQAEGRREDVDTVSDIYSLGVIAYEVLAGRPPHVLSNSSIAQAVRIISEREPTPIDSIAPACRGDIGVVVHAALQKEKSARYQSALSFAEDLERVLRNEPISARPLSAAYRVRKFAQRHKVLVGSVTIMLIGLSAALGIVSRLYVRTAAAETNERAMRVQSYVDAGRLAAERGDWATVIDWYRKAIAAGYAESVPLKISLVAAHDALGQSEEARAILDGLAAVADLGEQRGLFLLWSGELATFDPATNETGLETVSEAVEAGLPPAKHLYAKALLAETFPVMINNLRQSLELDPYDHRARQMLIMMLVMSGRLDEGRLSCAEFMALYPEHPSGPIGLATIEALRGSEPGVASALQRLKSMDENTVAVLREIFGIIVDAMTFAAASAEPDRAAAMELGLRLLPRAALVSAALPQLESDPSVEALVRGFAVRAPPAIGKSWGALFPALVGHRAWGTVTDEKLAEVLATATRVNPEGLLHCLYAQALCNLGRWKEALSAAKLARSAPAVMPIDQRAQRIIDACELQIALSDDGADAGSARASIQKRLTRELSVSADSYERQTRLGDALTALKCWNEAIKAREQELALARLLWGDAHSNVVWSLYRCALTQGQAGRLDEAIATLRVSVETLRDAEGDSREQLAANERLLLEYLMQVEQFDEAKETLRGAFDRESRRTPIDEPTVAQLAKQGVRLAELQQDDQEAARWASVLSSLEGSRK